MVAFGYKVERVLLQCVAVPLCVLCVLLTIHMHIRGNKGRGQLRFLLAVLNALASVLVVACVVDYPKVFNIYNGNEVAFLLHNAGSLLYGEGNVVIILHVELFYFFIRDHPHPSIRRGGVIATLAFWTLGNVAIGLMQALGNSFFYGVFFVLYFLGGLAILIFVNIAAHRVRVVLRQHLEKIRSHDKGHGPQRLTKITAALHRFRIALTVGIAAGLCVLATKIAKQLKWTPGVYSPPPMPADHYKFGVELVVVVIALITTNFVWLGLGELAFARGEDSNKSSTNNKHNNSVKGGNSTKGKRLQAVELNGEKCGPVSKGSKSHPDVQNRPHEQRKSTGSKISLELQDARMSR